MSSDSIWSWYCGSGAFWDTNWPLKTPQPLISPLRSYSNAPMGLNYWWSSPNGTIGIRRSWRLASRKCRRTSYRIIQIHGLGTRDMQMCSTTRLGREVRSRTDYLLGTDRCPFRNISIYNPQHNLYNYMIMGCLHSATLKEQNQYIGRIM